MSCLPMDLGAAHETFLAEAALDPAARWAKPRNVTTSIDLVNAIARLANWTVVRWLPGDVDCIPDASGQPRRLGQSIVVLANG